MVEFTLNNNNTTININSIQVNIMNAGASIGIAQLKNLIQTAANKYRVTVITSKVGDYIVNTKANSFSDMFGNLNTGQNHLFAFIFNNTRPQVMIEAYRDPLLIFNTNTQDNIVIGDQIWLKFDISPFK